MAPPSLSSLTPLIQLHHTTLHSGLLQSLWLWVSVRVCVVVWCGVLVSMWCDGAGHFMEVCVPLRGVQHRTERVHHFATRTRIRLYGFLRSQCSALCSGGHYAPAQSYTNTQTIINKRHTWSTLLSSLLLSPPLFSLLLSSPLSSPLLSTVLSSPLPSSLLLSSIPLRASFLLFYTLVYWQILFWILSLFPSFHHCLIISRRRRYDQTLCNVVASRDEGMQYTFWEERKEWKRSGGHGMKV